MLIDLHTHSTASDGTEPPAQVVASAAASGLDVVALTDHDTTAGWDEAAQAATTYGVALVRGTEVSCSHRGISIHLLSYLHDPEAPGLREEIEHARASREHRAEAMVGLIAEDYDISWEDVIAQAGDGATLGRPHIADAMVAKGIVPDRDAAFATVLHSRSGYHVSHYAPDPVTAVRLVRAAGGVPVMAHPLAYHRGRVVGDDVIADMTSAGLLGLEVDHRDHDQAARDHLRGLAKDLGLLVTGSSDYHGDGKPNRLGENCTSPEVLEAIEAAASGVPVVRP